MAVRKDDVPVVGCASAAPPSPVPADWRPGLPFVAVAVGYVLLGGLLAAGGYTAGWGKASWAAAYVVLVCGLAQAALGAGAVLLARRPPSRRAGAAQLALWNVGSLAVLVGDLTRKPLAVAAGGAILIAALAVLFVAARRGGRRVQAWWARLGYDTLVVALAISVGVGVLLGAR